MALTNDSQTGARILTMRPSSRDGLYALATAWQATHGSSVRPFRRLVTPSTPVSSSSDPSADEPPYWPDGPSAA